MSFPTPKKRRPRRLLSPVIAAGLVVSVGPVLPAQATNTVPTGRGDSWAVHDSALPGLDTGSVQRAGTNALQGYGGLRVEVEGGTSRLNGWLLRGFGVVFDGRSTFESTQGVNVDGVVVQRRLDLSRQAGYGRFFDSFTNTTQDPVTVDVAFGGQLGYNAGSNQTAIAGTSSGDTSITPADTWASWYSPSAGAGSASTNGPSATVIGSTAAEAGLVRMGNFLRDPFSNLLEASGDEANHPAFLAELTIEPGDTESLARYVVAGLSETRPTGEVTPAAGSEVAYVEATAADLVVAPDLAGLSTSDVCSIVNFDPAALGVTEDDCATASTQPIVNLVRNSAQAERPATTSPYDVTGRSITEQLTDIEAGVTNSQQIVRAYLDRIAAYDRGPFGLRSVLSVAPDAMVQARAADRARREGDDRPLLGVPILVKDIIDTEDMPTTGGSLQFDGWFPEQDSWQVQKLREAGAIILGKANLSRYAFSGHFSESHFGQVWNAFDPSRSPIGSSGGSGTATASSFGAAAMGTQTGDSLWGPSWAGSLYSLRGTDGMQSSAGTMPLTLIQDYVGFMTQSLDDLALLLQVAAVDNPDDVLDDVANGNRPENWTEYFTDDALQGKTIGIPAGAFDDPFGTTETSDALRAQLATFERAGASVVDMPAAPAAPMRGDFGSTYGEGWIQWFEAHPSAPVDITDVVNNPSGMTDEQQRAFEAWRADYRELLATWMDENGVDAVLYPEGLSDIHLNDSTGNSFGRRDPLGSAAGVPNVIFPAGTNSHGSPIGFQLQGKAFQDAELMGMVHAFEQVAGSGRVLPEWSTALEYDADAIPAPVEDLEPERPVRRPTLLGADVLGSRADRVAVRVGCASVDEACTSRVTVRTARTAPTTVRVRTPAGGQRRVVAELDRKDARKVRRGKRIVLKVTFDGSDGTESTTRPIRIAVRR